MSVLENMIVRVSADTTPLANGLRGAITEVQKASKGINGALSFVSKGIAGLAAAFSVQKVVEWGIATLKWADDLGDLAQTLGVTTEKLQALHYAAIGNGSSIEEVDAAMVKFTQVVGDAAHGGGALVDRMRELGIRALDANGSILPLDELLPQVADAINRAGTAQDKLSIATDFFGRQAAPSMVRMLAQGSDGLAALEQSARDAGAVLSDDLVQSAAKTNEQFELLEQRLSVTLKGATLSFIGDMQQVASEIYNVGDAIKLIDRAFQESFLGRDTSQQSGLTKLLEERAKLTEQYAADPTNQVLKEQIDLLNKQVELRRQIFFTAQNVEKVSEQPSQTTAPQTTNRFIQSRTQRAATAGAATKSQSDIVKELQKGYDKLDVKIDSFNSSLYYQTQLLDDIKTEARDTFREFVFSVSKGENALSALKRTALNVIESIATNMMNLSMGGQIGGGIGGALAGMITHALGATVTATSGPMTGQQVVPSFAVGTPYVPRDMLANIHKGEMIIPARQAAQMRSGKSGSTVVNQTINISTGVQQTVRAEIARMAPQIKQLAVSGVSEASRRSVQGAY